MGGDLTTRKLTASEKMAVDYLKRKGHQRIEKIDDRSGGKPDLLVDGDYYEVKTTHRSSLTFTRAQMNSFARINPYIVVVEKRRMRARSVSDMVLFSKLEESGYTIYEQV